MGEQPNTSTDHPESTDLQALSSRLSSIEDVLIGTGDLLRLLQASALENRDLVTEDHDGEQYFPFAGMAVALAGARRSLADARTTLGDVVDNLADRPATCSP